MKFFLLRSQYSMWFWQFLSSLVFFSGQLKWRLNVPADLPQNTYKETKIVNENLWVVRWPFLCPSPSSRGATMRDFKSDKKFLHWNFCFVLKISLVKNQERNLVSSWIIETSHVNKTVSLWNSVIRPVDEKVGTRSRWFQLNL